MLSSSFNDLAWTESEDNSRGVIAGALENGSLDLWDADKLLNGARFAGLGNTRMMVHWADGFRTVTH